jgi:hypothetical protein
MHACESGDFVPLHRETEAGDLCDLLFSAFSRGGVGGVSWSTESPAQSKGPPATALHLRSVSWQVVPAVPTRGHIM